MKRERDNNRINKAIDAMIKIQDDGEGTDQIARILELLNLARNEGRE